MKDDPHWNQQKNPVGYSRQAAKNRPSGGKNSGLFAVLDGLGGRGWHREFP
ncbi:MAG: hypothetical protein R3F37_00870 [Candidatus Competibacteraceae bacterium]